MGTHSRLDETGCHIVTPHQHSQRTCTHHRIPFAAYSIAAALAIPTTACFEATYAALVLMPTRPVMEAMLTIEPRCRRTRLAGLVELASVQG